MEAELGTALKRRGTLYSGLPEGVLQDLASAAQRHGLLTAKETAAAFDKWMAVHRCGRRRRQAVARAVCAQASVRPLQARLRPPLFAPPNRRLGVKSVGAEDVAAWASEYGKARPQAARPGNLFNRVSLEE